MSVNEMAEVAGTHTVRWMTVNGRSGWYAIWLDGTVLPVISGGDGSGDSDGDSGDSDSDDDNDEDDDDDEDDEDDDDSSKSSKSKSSDKESQLRAEAKKRRLQVRDAKKRADDLEAENKKLKADKMSADEKLQQENKDLKEQLQKLTDGPVKELSTLRFYKAFRDAEDEGKVRFEDGEEALLLITNKSKYKDLIEVDDDTGEITGMDEAVKALAKDKPRLLVASGNGEDDEDDDDNDDAERKPKSSGGKSFSKRRKSAEADEQKLLTKYPALRR